MKLRWDRQDQPATGIERAAAAAFCAWTGGRLPTAEEWLYAARGGAGDRRIYPWGDEPVSEGDLHRANYGMLSGPKRAPSRKDGHPYAAPVGMFSERGRSPFGVANLSGNAREWTATDAPGGAVVLGGGWRDLPHELRITRREIVPPEEFANDLGFRCVRDLSGAR